MHSGESLKGTKGVPRKGIGTSVNMRACTSKESRVKHDQTSCRLRPPILGTALVPSRLRVEGLREQTGPCGPLQSSIV